MHLLASTAQRIIKDYRLKALSVPSNNVKKWQRLSWESLGIAHEHETEYRAYATEHRDTLDRDYGIDRTWWLAAFHWYRADRLALPKEIDWWTTYRTILGTPHKDFPDYLDWRIIPHHQWQRLKKILRKEFQKEFEAKYPKAKQVEACETSRDLWQTWNEWVYVYGVDELWGTWWKCALQNLEQRRDLIGLIY